MASKKGKHENMTRLGMAIIDELTPILRDVLQRNIQQNQLYKDVKSKNMPLRPEQEKLVAKAKTVGYTEFDITLLYTLIRNLCHNVPKPTNGWGKDPGPSDTTLGDDIERIRNIRNDIYAHIPSTNISDSEFEKYWSEIDAICHRLEGTIGGNLVDNLSKIETCVVDEKLEQKYLELLKEQKNVEDDIRGLREHLEHLHVKEGQQQPPANGENINPESRTVITMTSTEHQDFRVIQEVACDSINAVVDEIDEQTSVETFSEILEGIVTFGEQVEENHMVTNIVTKMKEKIDWYHGVDPIKGNKVLFKFFKVTTKLMAIYKTKPRVVIGSLVFDMTFRSIVDLEMYQQDVDNGIVSNLLSEVLLFPTFLSLFDLHHSNVAINVEHKSNQFQGHEDDRFHMEQIAMSKETYSQVQDVVRCDLCMEAAVQVHCNTCHISTCNACVSNHIVSDLSRKHLVVEYNKRSNVRLEECDKHRTQICDLHCKQCFVSACSKCMTSTHASHPVIDILDFCVLKEHEIRQENKEIETSKMSELQKATLVLQDQIATLPEQYDSIMEGVTKYGNVLHKEIDMIIKRFTEDIEKMKTADLNRLRDHQRKLEELISLHGKIVEENKRVLQAKNVSMYYKHKSGIQEIASVPLYYEVEIPQFDPSPLHTMTIENLFGSLKSSSVKAKDTLKAKDTPIVKDAPTSKTRESHHEHTCSKKCASFEKFDEISTTCRYCGGVTYGLYKCSTTHKKKLLCVNCLK